MIESLESGILNIIPLNSSCRETMAWYITFEVMTAGQRCRVCLLQRSSQPATSGRHVALCNVQRREVAGILSLLYLIQDAILYPFEIAHGCSIVLPIGTIGMYYCVDWILAHVCGLQR